MKKQVWGSVALTALLLSPLALAIPPTHQIDELPSLAQEPQHEVASKRVSAYFTRYHFKHMELNNELSSAIHDRSLKMLKAILMPRKNIVICLTI